MDRIEPDQEAAFVEQLILRERGDHLGDFGFKTGSVVVNRTRGDKASGVRSFLPECL